MHRTRRLRIASALVLILLSQSGCVLTSRMWRAADAKVLAEPQLLVTGTPDAPQYQVMYRLASAADHGTYLYDVSPQSIETLEAFTAEWLSEAATRPTKMMAPHPIVSPIDQSRLQEARASWQPRFVRQVSDDEARTLVEQSIASPLDSTSESRYLPWFRKFELRNSRSQIVAIPSTQPRPAGPRNAAIAGAIALTPFTAAADVVLSPVYLFVLLNMPRH